MTSPEDLGIIRFFRSSFYPPCLLVLPWRRRRRNGRRPREKERKKEKSPLSSLSLCFTCLLSSCASPPFLPVCLRPGRTGGPGLLLSPARTPSQRRAAVHLLLTSSLITNNGLPNGTKIDPFFHGILVILVSFSRGFNEKDGN